MSKKNTAAKTETAPKSETATVNAVHASFVKLLRPILAERTVGEDADGNKVIGPQFCVSGRDVAKVMLRKHKAQLPEHLRNEYTLYHIICAAVACEQVKGFWSRLGRNGGIYQTGE